jgi:uncharacterized protein (DUF4415 family)
MSANAKVTKRRVADLPTLDDVAKGKISLDDYEIAHGEDIPEWTEADFALARPMKEMFPEIIEAFERMRGERGPQKSPVKERVGMRLDADIVRHFRDTGPGWQSRVNDVLRAHLASQANSMGKHT